MQSEIQEVWDRVSAQEHLLVFVLSNIFAQRSPEDSDKFKAGLLGDRLGRLPLGSMMDADDFLERGAAVRAHLEAILKKIGEDEGKVRALIARDHPKP